MNINPLGFNDFNPILKKNTGKQISSLPKTVNDVFIRCTSIKRELAQKEINYYFRKYLDPKFIQNQTSKLSDDKLSFLNNRKTEYTDFINKALENKDNKNILENKELVNLGFSEQTEFINDFYDSKEPNKYDDAKDLYLEYKIERSELKGLFDQYYDSENREKSIAAIEKEIEKLQQTTQMAPQAPTTTPPETEYDNKEILFEKINKEFEIPEDYWEKYSFEKKIDKYYVNDIFKIYGELIAQGNYNLSEDDFKRIFEDFDLSKEKYKSGNKEYYNINLNPSEFFMIANEKFASMRKIIDKTPKGKDESSSDYYQRLMQIFDEQEKAELAEKSEILGNVGYNKDFSNPKRNLLTEEEKEEISKRHGFDSYGQYCCTFLEEYVGSGRTTTCNLKEGEYEKIFTSVLEDYCESYERQETPDSPQLARWLCISEADTDFFDTFPEHGEIYTTKNHQSCSKNIHYAETEFSDANSEKNVKFVIYPKTEDKFKAYNIGEYKYGNNEVIYPDGSQFKVLYKGWEEKEVQSEITGDFVNRHYVIYLQEI